jgi:hypothetical protein
MSDEGAYKKEYAEYLARAEAVLGDLPVGHYKKFQGRLVKKLSHEEFVTQYDQYLEIRRRYDEILRYGDTVNDAIVHLLDEHAAELLIKL